MIATSSRLNLPKSTSGSAPIPRAAQLQKQRSYLKTTKHCRVLRLALGLWWRHEQQHNSAHSEHAEGRLLAVPGFRLPHQKPLAADTEKGDQRHKESASKRRNGDALGLIERASTAPQGSRQTKSAPPAENHGDRLPRDDRIVEEHMPRRRIQSAPHAVIPGQRRVHHQDMANELIVRRIVRYIVENDERIESRDRKDEKHL